MILVDNFEENEFNGVAIVGMACRFPGASTIDEYWKNICNGVESISFFSHEELDTSISDDLKKHSDYVKARGIIKDVDKFDAKFFGMNTLEAETMDPQQRIFLELAWHCLEDAGYNQDTYDGIVGVYAGMGNNTYLQDHVLNYPAKVEALGEFQAMLANEKDYLATRVAFKLNLTGPAISLYTACSTSLVSVCSAFDSLTSYQCDMALAGGISIVTPQKTGYLYQDGHILSKDGYCRPFDSKASGTVPGNGAGIVALKRLEDAIGDGDNIYAVIKGTAINNDGSNKMSFAAPSVQGQTEVIAMALANADISPETIAYVETHGTGTLIGDPIEVEALTQAFRTQTNLNGFCAIGSVKSNIGHLDAAAGVASLIKTVLVIKYGEIPPSLHFENCNPEIKIDQSPFYVNKKLKEWPMGTVPKRAGVSCFGIGGTNAHVILEDAPKISVSQNSEKPYNLLIFSANSKQALNETAKNLKNYLEKDPGNNISDIAFSLSTGRKPFRHRRMLVCKDIQDAVEMLQEADEKKFQLSHIINENPEIIFMFPGQGSQYVNMGL
ncbi:MAG: type I polyketide synthase, partial [Bacteroidetes bacterium]|nr:type I polyketide synthase [Bacteroidota bacterium]